MAAYNKELRSSDGVDIIYPITKAKNVFLSDNQTDVESALPELTLNGEKTSTINIFAPTASGEAGQVLTSNGPNSPPTWSAQSSQVQIKLNGQDTTTPEFYAPVNGGRSGYFLKSNGSGAPTWAAISSGPDIVVSSSQPYGQKSGDFWYQIV